MTGRSLAEPAFPGDDGLIDPALEPLLGDDLRLLAAFGRARVFVPIVPVLGEQATDGTDKSADMAAVLMRGQDGRQALLAFTSVVAMRQWNAAARPVPVYGRDAAKSALDESAAAVLLDLGQRHFQVIEADDVQHVADGDTLVRTGEGTAWVRSG